MLHLQLYKEIVVGSRAFFEGVEGFVPSDKDVVIFEKNPSLYNFYMQTKIKGIDTFKWNVDNIFNYDYSKNPMAVGKFLVPEILTELGLDFSEVVELIERHIYNLEPKHNYQVKIFEFYKLNNKPNPKLTKKQLTEVYNIYKEKV